LPHQLLPLGDKPVYLSDLYWRKDNKTDEFWTKLEAAKVKFPNKDVFILTSNYTFSGAEEFSFNLQNLKRATIIGETTGGVPTLAATFACMTISQRSSLSAVRSIRISKTNWEGTGVEPDIKVLKGQALKLAYLWLSESSAIPSRTTPSVRTSKASSTRPRKS
jgi:retinol-binding protein 3